MDIFLGTLDVIEFTVLFGLGLKLGIDRKLRINNYLKYKRKLSSNNNKKKNNNNNKCSM